MSLFKKDSNTRKYVSLEDEMVSQVQTGIRSIADDDNELSNKATEEIRDYFKTFSVAFDLHLETIKEITKELKIKYSPKERSDIIRKCAIFARFAIILEKHFKKERDVEKAKERKEKLIEEELSYYLISLKKMHTTLAKSGNLDIQNEVIVDNFLMTSVSLFLEAYEYIKEQGYDSRLIRVIRGCIEYGIPSAIQDTLYISASDPSTILLRSGINMAVQTQFNLFDITTRRIESITKKYRDQETAQETALMKMLGDIHCKLLENCGEKGNWNTMEGKVRNIEKAKEGKVESLLKEINRKTEQWKNEGYKVEALENERDKLNEILKLTKLLNDTKDKYCERKITLTNW